MEPTGGQARTEMEMMHIDRGQSRMSEELIAVLRQRVDSKYYDQPQVIEIIARAILHSRGVYI